MNEKEVLAIFEEMGVIMRNGHFVFTNWRHAREYLNKALIFTSTWRINKLCRTLALNFFYKRIQPEVITGPIVGGAIIAQWVTHSLNNCGFSWEVKAVFAEDGLNDTKIFKRGYDKLIPGKRVLVVDDILTTGGSVKKIIDSVKTLGGQVVGAGAFWNRGGVRAEDIGVPELFALVNKKLEDYDESNCPLCLQGIPINTEVGKGKEYLAQKAK
jgi:orotate phosphoribosyltransferase